jgi:hypothetical protein
MNQLLNAAVPRAEQISALEITTSAAELDAALTALMPRSRLLTRLRLQAVPPLCSNIALNQIPGHITYLDIEHGYNVPARLTHLWMKDCYVNLPLYSITSLTNLVIDWSWMAQRLLGNRCLSMKDLLDVLKNCSVTLEVLKIVNAIAPWRPEDDSDDHNDENMRYPTPNLHTLVLEEASNVLWKLATTVVASSPRTVVLIDSTTDRFPEDAAIAHMNLLLNLHLAPKVPATYLSLAWTKIERAQIQLSPDIHESADSRVLLHLEGFQDLPPVAFISTVIQCWRPGWLFVRELRLDFGDCDMGSNSDCREVWLPSEEMIHQLLCYMPHIERLQLAGAPAAIMVTNALLQADSRYSALCPALTMLVLERMNVAMNMHGLEFGPEGPDHHVEIGDNIQQVLYNRLSGRRGVRQPVQFLQFLRCTLHAVGLPEDCPRITTTDCRAYYEQWVVKDVMFTLSRLWGRSKVKHSIPEGKGIAKE